MAVAFGYELNSSNIDGARRAGMTPIWINSVGVWPEEIAPPPYTIQSIGEIPELLKKIEQEAKL